MNASVRSGTNISQRPDRLPKAPILDPYAPLSSAREFVARRHHSDGIVTLRHQGGTFFAYSPDCGVYVARDESAIRAELYRFLETALCLDTHTGCLAPFQPTQARVSNIMDALRAHCHASNPAPYWLHEDDDPGVDPRDVLACPNGLLDIVSRVLFPPTPSFFSTNALMFPYDDTAPEPKHWLTFLRELWTSDSESRQTLQEVMGYLLVPRTDQQKAFMLVGPPRSGKGTIGRVIRRLVGEANCCAPTLASLSKDFGMQNMIGKTVALVADARISGRVDTAVIAERLLSITGEDAQSISRKYAVDWNGRLTARFVLMTNELPAIVDQSGAFASRFIVLALTKSFLGHEDHGLETRLVSELPGILNWALEGYDRLRSRGYFVRPQSANQLIQQLDDLGSPVGAFLRECCDTGPGFQAMQSQIFDAWNAWCEASGREHPGTIQQLGKNLVAAVPGLKVIHPRISGTPVRHWQGVRLKARR